MEVYNLIYRFIPQLLIFVACFFAVAIFVVADYYSGKSKALANGEKLLSAKMRRTTNKSIKYMLILFGCFWVDLVQMLALHVINTETGRSLVVIPVFSIIITIWNCYIEYKSIRESYSQKRLRDEKEAFKDLKQTIDYLLEKKNAL